MFFIDPDGMAPIAGMQTGAVEHAGGFEVTNKDGSNAGHFSNVNDAYAAAAEIIASNNAQIYSGFFKNAADEAANAHVGLGGGKCPDGDCGENMVSIISDSETKVVGGHVFSALEIVLEKTTEYIVGEAFDIFGWDKDYQDGTIIAASLFFNRRNVGKVAAKKVSKLKFPGKNPGKAPKGFEWKGQPGSTPGSKNGNWYNPKTGESLRPDLNHSKPIGPHWDYKDSSGKWWRIFPDGSNIPK